MKESTKEALLTLMNHADSLGEFKKLFDIYVAYVKTEKEVAEEVIEHVKSHRNLKGLPTGYPRSFIVPLEEGVTVVPVNQFK